MFVYHLQEGLGYTMYKGASKKRKLPVRNSNVYLCNTRSKTVQSFHPNNCGAVETDWTNRYRNEVRVSEKVCRKKESRSLWQDLSCSGGSSTQGKSSFIWNTKSGHFDDCNGPTRYAPSLKLVKDVTGLDQQNKGGCPSIYDSLTPCAMTLSLPSTVSAEVSYGAPNNYISGAESCAKDVSKKILDSITTDIAFIKSICGSVGNSQSGLNTLGHENSKHDNEISEDCAMLNGFCPVNPGMICPGALLSSSLELQVSEVLSDPKNCSDMEQGGLIYSSEIDLDTDGKNLPSLTEEWEVGKIVNGRKSSECSQFDDPHTKSGLECGDQESKMKLHKKRKHIYSEVQSSSDKPVGMFLRSMKKALTVQPRRSMRLISKVL
ncbi:hypothetical protein JHK84_041505 [Glycine max]|nr:hypothetical protein JHK85_041904 [Glycine max]KAG5115392.1 hypothetical protein JHK84_041505 [Glycine max]